MLTYDVIVIGGGTGGVPAAVAAARAGARTLLVERYGFLGGMATAGLINPFMGYWAGARQIVAGIFDEMLNRLRDLGGLAEDATTFDEEALKLVLDDLVREAGVDVLFHSTFVDCSCERGRIKSASLVSKGGPFEVEAHVFIDASGDGDLAAAAGATVELGREEDGLSQPMTLCFRVAGVDLSTYQGSLAAARAALNKAYLDAKADGRVDNPREDILVFKTMRDDVLHFNTTRVVGLNPVSAADLSRAEFEGRRQTRELIALFKSDVPGFANAYLQKSAALIGVRESRRVIGEYVLTAEDVLEGRRFPDAVACSRYPIDIHNPSGTGTVIRTLPEGQWYEIPYRCLVPKGVLNLLMATRAISATHEAHASLRIMPVVAALGQAAGAAAAMASQLSVQPAGIDTALLREKLREAGAYIGEAQ